MDVPPTAPIDTGFQARWEAFTATATASAGRLPPHELRSLALEFFSWGAVHAMAQTDRLRAAAAGDQPSTAK